MANTGRTKGGTALQRAALTLRTLVTGAAPVTYAIGAAAFLAASVFVVADAAGALGLSGLNGSDSLLVARASAGDLVGLTAQAQPGAFSGVALRGFAAFGGALLLTGAGYRRRTRPVAETRRIAYDDLVSAIPLGIACWSEAGDLLACNTRYAEQLSEVPAGATYTDAIKQLAAGGYTKLIREDESNRLVELHREDGSCLMLDERPLSGGGFMTLLTDITDRRRADSTIALIREEQKQLARQYHEEKLRAEAASRAKTAFLAHLSHDIRTPLNHIIGFADLIRHQTYGPIGDSRYLNYVETIKGSGEQLLQHFAAILDLAELEGGQREFTVEPVNIDTLIDACARKFRTRASRAGLGFVVGAASGAVLMADRFALDRMIDNIVENAVRFTPSGGKVSLACYPALDGVVLEITDTGIGMAPERLEALSQPFAFGDASFSKEHPGSGLGIPIARTIAELSGGRLAIDSRPGLGTTVAISLPLEAAERVAAA